MENLNLKLIGQRLKTQRKQLNITQEDMSEDLKITTYFISRIENGKSNISITLLNDICNYLQMDITDVFQGTNTQNDSYLEKDIAKRYMKMDAKQKDLILEIMDSILKHTS